MLCVWAVGGAVSEQYTILSGVSAKSQKWSHKLALPGIGVGGRELHFREVVGLSHQYGQSCGTQIKRST